MKKILIIVFILTSSLCFSQTKQQLIDSIIIVNRVESDCIGNGCMMSKQYARFQKLKKRLSDEELIALSKHENPTIRTYAAKELIHSGKGNLLELLTTALDKNEEVETFEGCLMDVEPIASIIYHEYWNKIRIAAAQKSKGNNYEQELAMQKAVVTDVTMEKLDSIILYSEKEVDWLLYDRAFENRKYKDRDIPRIKELAFRYNNFYAFAYLQEYYATAYAVELENYLQKDFPKASFQTENEDFHLESFIEMLLQSKNDAYKKIAGDKVKNN